MFINSDFSDLLRLFTNTGVRYLVIGGYAVIQHRLRYQRPRFMDSFRFGKMRLMFRALHEFQAPLRDDRS